MFYFKGSQKLSTYAWPIVNITGDVILLRNAPYYYNYNYQSKNDKVRLISAIKCPKCPHQKGHERDLGWALVWFLPRLETDFRWDYLSATTHNTGAGKTDGGRRSELIVCSARALLDGRGLQSIRSL